MVGITRLHQLFAVFLQVASSTDRFEITHLVVWLRRSSAIPVLVVNSQQLASSAPNTLVTVSFEDSLPFTFEMPVLSVGLASNQMVFVVLQMPITFLLSDLRRVLGPVFLHVARHTFART